MQEVIFHEKHAHWGDKTLSVLNAEEYFQKIECTIDESIKGAASLSRYGITFDDNINIKYKTPPVTYVFLIENCMLKTSLLNHFMLSYLEMSKINNEYNTLLLSSFSTCVVSFHIWRMTWPGLIRNVSGCSQSPLQS